jgi:hypothetical protein
LCHTYELKEMRTFADRHYNVTDNNTACGLRKYERQLCLFLR